MSEPKLSKESARKELQKFYDYYEVEKSDLSSDSQKALEGVESVVIKGFQNGYFEIVESDKGFCVMQRLKSNPEDTFTYKELNGEAKLAMSSKKEDDVSGRIYAMLGSLSGEGAAVIAQFKSSDLKRAEHFGSILLFC